MRKIDYKNDKIKTIIQALSKFGSIQKNQYSFQMIPKSKQQGDDAVSTLRSLISSKDTIGFQVEEPAGIIVVFFDTP